MNLISCRIFNRERVGAGTGVDEVVSSADDTSFVIARAEIVISAEDVCSRESVASIAECYIRIIGTSQQLDFISLFRSANSLVSSLNSSSNRSHGKILL